MCNTGDHVWSDWKSGLELLTEEIIVIREQLNVDWLVMKNGLPTPTLLPL